MTKQIFLTWPFEGKNDITTAFVFLLHFLVCILKCNLMCRCIAADIRRPPSGLVSLHSIYLCRTLSMTLVWMRKLLWNWKLFFFFWVAPESVYRERIKSHDFRVVHSIGIFCKQESLYSYLMLLYSRPDKVVFWQLKYYAIALAPS